MDGAGRPARARAQPRLRAREGGGRAAEEERSRGRAARRRRDDAVRLPSERARRRRCQAVAWRAGSLEGDGVALPGYIHIEEAGDVAVVRIDRPPANALDLDLLAEGHEVRERLAGEGPGAVVLTGTDRFFSAGMDLKAAPGMSTSEQRHTVGGINRLFSGWYSFPRPVVAGVNGHAVAGGLILALCADRRVGATDGRLGLTELRAGLPYPLAAISVVRAELSAAAARRLALGAELFSPEEALELGLVDEIVERDRVVPRALEIAAGLAELPRATYAQVKMQLRGPTIDALDRALSSGAGDPVLGGWVGEETSAAAAGLLKRD